MGMVGGTGSSVRRAADGSDIGLAGRTGACGADATSVRWWGYMSAGRVGAMWAARGQQVFSGVVGLDGARAGSDALEVSGTGASQLGCWNQEVPALVMTWPNCIGP